MKQLAFVIAIFSLSNFCFAVEPPRGWDDLGDLNQDVFQQDSIDKAQIENHPLNQTSAPNKSKAQNLNIKPVTLHGGDNIEGSSQTLKEILPEQIKLKEKNNQIKQLKVRKTYDYRSKPPAPFFRKEKFDKNNAHLPGVFYQSDYSRLLLLAANKGDIGATSNLLSRGASINSQIKDSGFTALMIAVENKFGNLTQYLTLRGADLNMIDNNGRTALHLAARAQDYAAVNFLLDNGADMYAIDIEGKAALEYLPEDKRVAIIVNRLTSQKEFDRALLDFSASGSYLGASLILNRGANINAFDAGGNTPLILATWSGNKNLILLLLAHGANPIIHNKYGMGAMEYAISRNDLEMAQILDTYIIKKELETGVHYPRETVLIQQSQQKSTDSEFADTLSRAWGEFMEALTSGNTCEDAEEMDS
ncbi:MAG: ankyrin repeat domain-containing protein [Candidatus Jidaibacter sp.]|jgi:ankyrin repeat protein|nr:ankyrin repeat domain-containing protein [Candidatus Jidaibacter sp.]